jgi:hypothetical protein
MMTMMARHPGLAGFAGPQAAAGGGGGGGEDAEGS